MREDLSEFWLVFKHNNAAVTGLAMFLIILSVAVFAPFISPYDPYAKVGLPMQGPSDDHLLGTNDIGQDILSELIYGSRISLLIGFVAAVVATLIGTFVGMLAGYYGGAIDELLMRITDVWLSFPGLLLTIFLATVLIKTPIGGKIIYTVIVAIALNSWPGVSRLVRSVTLKIKELPFIEAARAIGASNRRILLRHIIPNATPIILVAVLTRIDSAMLTEASLSFLGVGDPTVKSWGMIIHYAMIRNAIVIGMWWWFIPPGLMISLSVLSIILVSMGIEEYINPRLRESM
jgi:peptide/nickel transport system permease protein